MEIPFKEISISGGLGVLLGVAAVIWIDPTTSEGTTAIIAIVAIATGTIGGIAAKIWRK